VAVTAGVRARNAMAAANAAGTATISQVLDGHVRLEVECLDRVVRHEAPSSRVGVRDLHHGAVAAAR
jgi:hypothetical protein